MFKIYCRKFPLQNEKVIFFNYLEYLLDHPERFIKQSNIRDISHNLQVLQKIIYVLDPSWAKDFYKEYIRI